MLAIGGYGTNILNPGLRSLELISTKPSDAKCIFNLPDFPAGPDTYNTPVIVGTPTIAGVVTLVVCFPAGGAGGSFYCFALPSAATSWTLKPLLQTYIPHSGQPGLFVGNILYMMDNDSPESIDFSGANPVSSILPAPPRRVGFNGCLAQQVSGATVTGFYYFGGSVLPTVVLFYTISTRTWTDLGNILPFPSFATSCLTFDTTAGSNKILVGFNPTGFASGTILASRCQFHQHFTRAFLYKSV